MELTKEILDNLYEDISPVLSKLFKREYLGNLRKSNITDFGKWLKLLHTKLNLNKSYRKDFIIYLRNLIKEIYTIISELWDTIDLPKFERTIRDNLKDFSYSSEEFKSSNIKELDLENEKSNAQIFAEKEDYIKFLEILRSEITKLVSAKELHRDRLANWRLAKYLDLPFGERKDGRKWDTISTISKGERHLTIEDLEKSKKSLLRFFGGKTEDTINIINNFLDDNRLRRYSKQQWHLHNPKLKNNFFTGIANEEYEENNIVSSYWFGFMGSDASVRSGLFKQSKGSQRDHRYRYDVTIELSKNDRGLLRQFCDTIGLDHSKIKDRPREKWGKVYIHSYVSFGCREMIDDLNVLAFSSSKEKRKKIPHYVNKALEQSFKQINRNNVGPWHLTNTIAGKIALVWLRGAYDGDGSSNKTELGSASKMYLKSIKRAFKIKHPLRSPKSNFWVLSLGARLFNSMTTVSMEYGLGLERKNKHFSENREALDILKELLEDLNVDKDCLQDLVYKFRQYEVLRMFSTIRETFKKLLLEWNIELPPNGYWTSKDKLLESKH